MSQESALIMLFAAIALALVCLTHPLSMLLYASLEQHIPLGETPVPNPPTTKEKP